MKKYLILLFLFITSYANAQSGEIFTSGRTTEGIIVQDEGTTVSRADFLNFTGDGVEVTSDSAKMFVAISGAASSGSGTTVDFQEAGSSICTSASCDTVDFRDGFDTSESPTDTALIDIDLTELALTDSNIFVGNSSNLIASVAVSGHITIDTAGSYGIQSSAINDQTEATLATEDTVLFLDNTDGSLKKVDAYKFIGARAKIAFEDPVATDDDFFHEADRDGTIKSIYCKTLVGTVDLDVTVGGSAINGSDITCNTSGVLDETLAGTTSMVVGDELKLAITSVASSPTHLYVQVNYDEN